jgi:hypothetical protein
MASTRNRKSSSGCGPSRPRCWLAGVLGQLILSTSGPLASIPVSVRIGAAVLGFAAFLITKRSVFAGVLTGEAAILLGTYFLET